MCVYNHNYTIIFLPHDTNHSSGSKKKKKQALQEPTMFDWRKYVSADLAEKLVNLFKYEHIRAANSKFLLPAIEGSLEEELPATVRMILMGGGDLSWWEEMEKCVLESPIEGCAIQSKTQAALAKAQQDHQSRTAEQNTRLFPASYPPLMGYDRQYGQMSAGGGGGAGGGYPYHRPPPPPQQQQHHQAFYPSSMGLMPGYGEDSWSTGQGPQVYGAVMQQNHGGRLSSYQAPPASQGYDNLLHQKLGAGRSYEADPSQDVGNDEDAIDVEESETAERGVTTRKVTAAKAAKVPAAKAAKEVTQKKKTKKSNTENKKKKGGKAVGVPDPELQDVELSSSDESICFPDRLEAIFHLFQDNGPVGGNRNAYDCVMLESVESGTKAEKTEGTNVYIVSGTSGHGLWANTAQSIHYGKGLAKHLEKVGGAMGTVQSSPQDRMKDKLPRNRRELPENISFSDRPMTAASWGASLTTFNNSSIPLPANALMVGTNSNLHGCKCSQHEICGSDLEVGQRIVVLGANIKHQCDGVYKIGCFVVLPGSRIGCKVGSLRVPFDQLGFFINRVADVTYVAPKPTKKPENKKSDKLYQDVKGYCNITFGCEGGNFIQEPWKKSKRTGWFYMKNLPNRDRLDKKKNEESEKIETRGKKRKEAGGATG